MSVICVALLVVAVLAMGCNGEEEASTELEEEPTTDETFTEAKMSANSPEVAGVVVDAEGNPVEEARVYFVEGPVPLADIAALTDSSGRFALSAPVLGTYKLGVAFEGSAGLVQKTTMVEVGEERSINLEIRLNT